MKYLITGVSGLLGSNLAFNLSNKGNEIVGLDLIRVNIPKVKFIFNDLRDHASLSRIMKAERPEAVIHCAAITDVDWCETNEQEAFRINTAATFELYQLAKEVGAQFVFISTDSVFSGTQNSPYREEDAIAPLNIYAKTKAEAEKNLNMGKDCLILRTNIFGYNLLDKNSFSEWIQESLHNKRGLNMFEDVYFSPVLVNLFPEIIAELLVRRKTGIFHLSSTGGVSKYSFALALASAFGMEDNFIKPSCLENVELKAARPKYMILDNKKLCTYLKITIPDVYQMISKYKILYENNYHTILKSFKARGEI